MKNRRIRRPVEKEFQLPRFIITLSLVGLLIAYILVATITKSPYESPLCKVIVALSGVLFFTLGIVVKRQGNKVDLDYDSIVVWKMLVVLGILLICFSVFLFLI
ncbi:MAG: hypothetical protein K6E24_00975 [bacterium]|nr:hypothetical protein [bacterium]